MRRAVLFICFIAISHSSFSQTPTMQEKLYYTCKVWGFVKYYHSEVSTCQVNWDSVLLAVLPDVRTAATSTQFNDALMDMLNAAGPMALTSIYYPDTLPAELKRNRDWGWISSPALRPNVREILDTIKHNFWPHSNCNVQTYMSSGGFGNPWGGYLKFPPDTAMVNMNFHTTFPTQDQKLLMFFKLWNITRYFNPYNYVLTTHWDTILYHYAEPFGNAANLTEINNLYLRVVAALDDSHVYGFSYMYGEYMPPGYYSPRIKLKHVQGKYVVVRSMEAGISPGDALISVDGMTMAQWEDSLMKYYSAGSLWVKRRLISDNVLKRPTIGAYETIVFTDSTGATQTRTINTINSFASSLNDFYYDYYYPADSLNGIDWTIFDCNVGYMNFGNLTDGGTDSAYAAMHTLPAIVVDIRNYPTSGNAWALCEKLFDAPKVVTKLAKPDVMYPGTYYWQYVTMGYTGNPTPYYGRIVVIVDETSQSASEYTTMMLRKHSDVVIVGSNTAGADGNITWLQPSYDMRFGWTALGVFYPNGDSTQRIGIVPDTLAYPTIEGVRKHRDYVLEKALTIAGCDLTLNIQSVVVAPPYISIYPNPANETVVIKISGSNTTQYASVTITNISGKVMLQSTVTQSHNAIDIHTLPPGMYFVIVSTDTDNFVTKFVKA